MQRIARNTGALMLLDGLDECGSGAARERVLAAVNELMRSAGPKCRFLLTARPYAWPGGADPEQGVYALADLNDDQIEQFIRGWYQALVTRDWLSPGEAERKMTDLLDARRRPDLAPLAGNPLLLTLMATLHANRGRLPDDRADLYDESVDLLMLRWNRQIGADKALLEELAIPTLKLSDLREVLEELAFKVHEESVGQRHSDRRRIGEGRIAAARLSAAAEQQPGQGRGGGRLHREARRPADRPGREGRRAPVRLPPSHLPGVPRRLPPGREGRFPGRVRPSGPCRAGSLAGGAARWPPARQGRAWRQRGRRADRRQLDRGAPQAQGSRTTADWTCALLAGMQLQEIGLGAIQKRERTRVIAAARGRLDRRVPAGAPERQGGPPAGQRAHAGDVLSALGDPRFDPQRFYLPADDMLGFVHIPADPGFRIGTRKADAERVAKIIGTDVPDDEINDTGDADPGLLHRPLPGHGRAVQGLRRGDRPAAGDADALRDPDSRPVRYVDWHEALAYCEWLNEMLATAAGAGRDRGGPAGARRALAGQPAERAGVGEGGAGRAAGRRLLVGRYSRPESRQLRRLGDRRHLGGRLLPGQRIRSLRHDR